MEIPKIISISSYRYENFPQIALQNCKKIIKWQKEKEGAGYQTITLDYDLEGQLFDTQHFLFIFATLLFFAIL